MKNSWSPALTLDKLLMRFYQDLVSPDLSDLECCSQEMALLIKEDVPAFEAKAREWTKLYAVEKDDDLI